MSADGPHRDWAQFPTFRIWKCCKCHIIEPGHTCFFNLPSESQNGQVLGCKMQHKLIRH